MSTVELLKSIVATFREANQANTERAIADIREQVALATAIKSAEHI